MLSSKQTFPNFLENNTTSFVGRYFETNATSPAPVHNGLKRKTCDEMIKTEVLEVEVRPEDVKVDPSDLLDSVKVEPDIYVPVKSEIVPVKSEIVPVKSEIVPVESEIGLNEDDGCKPDVISIKEEIDTE